MAAEQVAAGFQEAGGVVKRIYLRDLDVRPCRACDACRETAKCVQRDDMQRLYQDVLEADVLVLSSPIYWWGVSAQLKAFIDRWYALVLGSDRPLFGKSAVLVFSFADNDPQTPRWAKGMMQTSLSYAGAQVVRCINIVAGAVGDAQRNCQEQLRQAYALGRSLV